MRKRNEKGGKKKSTCSKCGNPLEPTRVNKQRYCMGCHAAQMRANRPKHKNLPDEQRKKANTRAYTHVLIKRGVIKKEPCCICGSENSQAHHDDYNNPRQVKWFCRTHHLEHHKKPPNKPILQR